jgi:membrane associated rhomboid family serine protease
MFPIRDHNPSVRRAYVTYGLILLNIAVYAATWDYSPAQTARFFAEYDLRPAQFLAGSGLETILTAMFLHAGIMHLSGNMLYLWIFGDNLEDILGRGRFLMFFHICAGPASVVPMVGASGAIGGLYAFIPQGAD